MGVEASKPTNDGGGGNSNINKVNFKANDKPIIMVLGGPGTGKGTQCTRLKDEFGFKHISLGDILRNEVKQGSNIGKQCENLMKDGKLVPLPLTMQLMKKAIQTSGHHSGYLIDGFPRAVEQAKAFQQQVKTPNLVVYLHAPLQVLQHRLLQRGATSGRSDDNLNSIKKRFVTFKKESYPVVEYYERTSKSIVKRVCTITTPDDVYCQVREAVKSALANSSRLRRHIRRRTIDKVGEDCKRAKECHLAKRRHHRIPSRHHHRRAKRRKTVHHRVTVRVERNKHNFEECPGHPPGSPVAPPKPYEFNFLLSVARWCGMTEVSSQDPTTLIKPILSSGLFLFVILRTFECQDAIKAGNFEQFKGCFTRLKFPLEIAEKTVEKYAGDILTSSVANAL